MLSHALFTNNLFETGIRLTEICSNIDARRSPLPSKHLSSSEAKKFMRPSPCLKIMALLIATALLTPSLVFAQDATRPRRAQDESLRSSSTVPAASFSTMQVGPEPTVRIGLATDARSVTISTTSRLMNASDENAPPVPLAVARVRVESRNFAPQPQTSEATLYRVEIVGAATRVDAERAAGEIREQTNETSEILLDQTTNTWRIRVGSKLPRAGAEDLRSRLSEAGFPMASIVSASVVGITTPTTARNASDARTSVGLLSSRSTTTVTNSVRPVARYSSPTRAAVVYASGASMLFTSNAPVVFASADERTAPVRYNEKAYRGRIEVFANANGALTVVNVLGLEDYVRGVVPNELSPGGFPAIEAQKAQAIAARTYAVRNRNQFASQGFDLLPTTRSQVYGGLSTEHPLSSRAVDETRGVVATFKGAPINALYTSTCGGRTENSENIFTAAEPYLRGRECSVEEHKAHFAPFIVKSSREPADIREESNARLARDVALLAVNSFKLPSSRITDAWLTTPASAAEIRDWVSSVSRLTRMPLPNTSDDLTRAPAFSTALVAAFYGEARADVLMDDSDVEYILSFRDASEVPARNRADVAMLMRDGMLPLYPDATLRPREALTRARALHTIARLLEERGKLAIQKGTTRPTASGALILRSSKNRDMTMAVNSDAYLFRAFGDAAYQMRQLALVGGEPVTFHLNAAGVVDYLEVRPAPSGASAERFSPFTNWTTDLSVGEAQARLARWGRGIGSLTDLRVAQRGSSRRVTDLEMIGTSGTAHVRGGRIRSALGLREQLFSIDRRHDESGRVVGFTFVGRGWGHGVGLCQVGAYGLARAGLTHDKILKAYYTGIELTKLY
jgi:stage II sporulation protein D